MFQKRMLVLSALLLAAWIIGFYVYHTSLNGYLHLFPLLAVNCALSCLMRKEKRRFETSQGEGTSEDVVHQRGAGQSLGYKRLNSTQ